MQKVYGLTSDNGDGSASVHWFRDKTVVDNLLDCNSDKWADQFNMNDGGPSETLEFPDDLDLEACGFSFSDEEEFT